MPSGDHQPKKEEQIRSPAPRLVEDSTSATPVGFGAGLTKLLFAFTNRHRGKALELDSSHDTMRVLGPKGEELAVVNSEVALDHLLGCAEGTATPARPEEARQLDDTPPRSTPFRVSARGDDGCEYEGQCQVIGRERLFFEVTPSPPSGTQLRMMLVNPDDVSRTFRMKGTVAWSCDRADEFGFGRGVGMVCTWSSPELQAFLSESCPKGQPSSSPAH